MPSPFEPFFFLRSLDLFSGWEVSRTEALSDLAARAEVWTFSEGDQIRFPDEGPDGPVWVAEGCLTVAAQGVAPIYVGVRERLESPAGVSVRGQTSGRFVKVPEASWRDWLRQWPVAARRLGEAPQIVLPRSLDKSPLVLEPDEIPLHRFRKASPFLLLRATVPALFFLLFVAFGLLLFERFGMVAPWWALWLLPGSGMAVTAALIGLVAWEWSASTLVVTNRSLIVRQIDLWAHRSDFQKIALERIREAIFSKQGWIDSVLGLVTVEIEGDSPQGRLLFGGLARQTSFLEAMFSVKSHVGEAMSRPVIRQALADRAGGARVPRLESPAQPRKPKGIQARKLSWRVEKDHQIWFRRHPWFLWKRGLPWLGWIALILFLGLVAAGFWPQGGWPITGVVVLAAVFPAARILWETADWAYDRLSIQGDKIMMVHRRPLWFGEIRQEGNLEQVEQVGVHKASLSALLFDFGTITISLGAGDPFLFEQAHHPEWVQNEIFHRRTLLRQNKESQAAKNRLDEVSEILDTWDEARRAGYFFKKESPENKEEI